MEVFDDASGPAKKTQPLTEFKFQEHPIRTVLKDGEVWFVAADVGTVLEHSNSRMLIASLDDDEKDVNIFSTSGGDQKLQIINESGLYSLIMRSNLPKAKGFRRWVTHDVLPSIRKTGRYEANKGEEKLEPEAKSNKVFVGVPGPGHYQIIVYETGCTFLEVPDCDSTRLDHILLNLDVFCYTVKQIEAIWTKLRLTHQSLCDHDQTPDAARMNNSVTDASALATELLQR
jgi:prophage antirepressor-like protein